MLFVRYLDDFLFVLFFFFVRFVLCVFLFFVSWVDVLVFFLSFLFV